MPQKKGREIVLGVTGSIAAYTACDLINRLRERGYGVTVAMSKDAHHFVTPLTLATLSGREVQAELFQLPGRYNPVHTTLADLADLILIAPATADIIGRIAHGLADDLLTCVVMASQATVLFVPAMNVHMYQNPTVQENVTKLKRLKRYHFVGPVTGHLTCGYEEIGHVASVEMILKAVEQLLRSR